jgi:tRNA nucleotidyltransferase (CCA-adding enzyme)
VEAGLVALGLALFLPGHRRPPAPGNPGSAERYAPYVAGVALVVLAVAGVRALQPFATPPGVTATGLALSAAFASLDAGVREAFAGVAGLPLDLLLGATLLLLHPTMLLLAPTLWLLADEERAAKGVLASYAAFLLLATPLHWLLAIQVLPARPFPLFADLGALYFPLGEANAVPGTHIGLALCVALAARRSRNARFQPLAWAYPALTAAGLLYFGINGVVGVLSGIAVALLADGAAARAVSVERIAHMRIDAPPERKMAIRKAADDLLFALKWAAESRDLQVEPILVGSVAKDTYLGHKVDVDAFVLFPPDTPRATLEKEGLALGRAVLEQPEERFAEHPYLAGQWRGLEAEVVPAFKVASSAERMSAVDRTPFHTAYVMAHLEGLQRRDVRLLKQFLLGIGVYGAEAKVQGFSGYLAELLVIKCGSFRGVLTKGKDWRPGQLLALEPFEGVPRFQDPLVVIDPVDPTRNVASALSLENLLLFQEAAREYLKEPRLSFFFPRAVQPWPPERLAELLRKRGHALLAVRLPKPDILDDSLHAQLRKCAMALEEALERGGFKVLGWDAHATPAEGVVAFELESLTINEREVHVGPPLAAKEHAERFRTKWTGNERALSAVTEEQGRLVVARRRDFTNAATLVEAKALDLDLGKDLTALAKAKGFDVLAEGEALEALDKRFLTRFLQRARPWER